MDKVIVGISPVLDPSSSERDFQDIRVPRVYVDALQLAGAQVIVLPPVHDEEEAGEYLDRVDGVMLIGGHSPLARSVTEADVLPTLRDLNPERYLSDAAYARASRERRMPVFGVCRGMQVLNEALGGTMDYRRLGRAGTAPHYQSAPAHVATHEVSLIRGSRLRSLIGCDRLQVNSFHRTAVATPAPGLSVAAKSDDDVIEAIESTKGGFVLGVQFHPETMAPTDPSRHAYGAFVAAARAWHGQH